MSHERYVLSEKYNPYQANSKVSSENMFRGVQKWNTGLESVKQSPNHLLKFSNKNTEKRWHICSSKLMRKIQERR